MAYATINKPSDYFNTVLYTGNGTDDRSITGVGFQPDFLWIKERDQTRGHALQDSTRGATKYLGSHTSSGENTNANGVQAFESDGFQLGTDSDINLNTGTYVAWNWLANGGTTTSNTSGTITSTVQANTTAGFSIVTYTGTGSNATVGHGLNQAPEMIIFKERNGSTNWPVYHSGLSSATYALELNQTLAEFSYPNYFQSTDPTSSVFYIGTDTYINNNTDNYIAYCFHSVQGYSKFGSYTGNGSADGPFIYTGFRPAWIMIKGTSSLGGDQAYSTWSIWDINRSTYNVTSLSQQLTGNTSNAEGIRGNGSSGSGIDSFDILSNGFKIRNGSYEYNQGNYIYMAFAENPLVGTNGIPATAR